MGNDPVHCNHSVPFPYSWTQVRCGWRSSLAEGRISRIRLKQNSIYVNGKKHGSVTSTGFKRCSQMSNHSASTNQQTMQSNAQLDNCTPHLDPIVQCSQQPTAQSNQWLSLALWNAHSIVNKLDYIQSYIYSKSADIICITETWLYDSILNTEIFPHNYTIYRRDRGSRGGGVIIAISDNLTSKIVFCHTSLESIAVEVDISPKTLIVCMYVPPSCMGRHM